MREVPPARPARFFDAIHDLFSAGTLRAAVRVSRGFGELMERTPYADDELLISLGNSLKFHEQSVRRRQSLFGRLAVKVGRPSPDPNTIEIDGIRLKQLFALARTDPPAPVSTGKVYALDIEMLNSLIDIAAGNMDDGKSKST